MLKVILTLAAFIELTEVPFHMPLKSASGSGESGVPEEPTELADPVPADCPPPPLEHDHPASARTKASVTIRRIDLGPPACCGPCAPSGFACARQDFLTQALDTFKHLRRCGAKRDPDAQDVPIDPAHHGVPVIERLQPVVLGTDDRVASAANLVQREIALGSEILGRRQHPVLKVKLAFFQP